VTDEAMISCRTWPHRPGHRPTLATAEIDAEAVQMLHDWIKGMKE
jgi:hypothetical protein